MIDFRYYLSIFLRRLHWFMLLAGLGIAAGVTLALSLPPSYVSSVRLYVESSQIPGELAAPTVNVPARQRLQILQSNLLTRANLLDIANQVKPFPEQEKMSPDDILTAMRDKTTIALAGGRNDATMMNLSFEAASGQPAAAVVNAYLDRLLAADQENRTWRATQTQEFFQQEVTRLGQAMDDQSAKIVAFKQAHADALPDSVDFRRNQQVQLQERLNQAEREMTLLQDQRKRMVEVFESTGRVEGYEAANRTPEQVELDNLRKQLSDALLVYSPSNPRVQLLQRRIAQMQERATASTGETGNDTGPKSLMDVQLAEIDGRLGALETQRTDVQQKIEELTSSLQRTSANAIALEGLQRDYSNVQNQYNQATQRLASASAGERIELLSRGQRVSVIEQPSVPNAPSKPNRVLIAGAGSAGGIIAGLALIVLLEILNTTARRPSDIVRKLGVTPLVTIPYIPSPNEMVRRQGLRIAVMLAVIIAVPVAIYAVHSLYQPLDLIAARLMDRFGIRG
ncbi:lipopolysaccharide biosynthesis [Frigidibacter sp. MR17.14]|uniref:GumC family protein n=1 Tax=Frigidibacter sp. MR17.14 TaxID=3126509 RepID=UPI003012B4D4